MNIAEELRNLANAIEGTPINTIEERNITKELYSEFLIKLNIIKDHLENKKFRSKDLDEQFVGKFIDDYELRITRLR